MIDFELGQELETLRDRVRAFVREVAIPAEARDRSLRARASDVSEV